MAINLPSVAACAHPAYLLGGGGIEESVAGIEILPVLLGRPPCDVVGPVWDVIKDPEKLSSWFSRWQTATMKSDRSRYCGHRFAQEIISHAVWHYYRFCLSFRDAEDLPAKRGIIVSCDTIRHWCPKLGPEYARKLKRRQGRLDKLNSSFRCMASFRIISGWPGTD